ncbi:MAG: zf-HC2 domain-containing protein [Capsulimonas sp.]|uniref:anti-sigma factor family protein n=1 Tax=Capsulimonas sp. TaxID=2494211 RepID=UPI003266DEA1
MSHCHDTRENLSRLLDNDLSGAEATETAVHLDECMACRHEYDRLRAVRAAMQSLATPEDGGARNRVFGRLESQAHPSSTPHTSVRAPRRPWPSFHLRPAYAAGLGAAASACIAFLVFNPGVPPATATPLPSTVEMSQFYALHDAHLAGLSSAEPVGHRDLAAEGRATLIASADESVGGSL